MSAFPGYATSTGVRAPSRSNLFLIPVAAVSAVALGITYAAVSLLGVAYQSAAYEARLNAIERTDQAQADLILLRRENERLAAPGRIAAWAESEGFVDPVATVNTRGDDDATIKIQADADRS